MGIWETAVEPAVEPAVEAAAEAAVFSNGFVSGWLSDRSKDLCFRFQARSAEPVQGSLSDAASC